MRTYCTTQELCSVLCVTWVGRESPKERIYIHIRASPVAQTGKNPPAVQETWVRSPGWEDPLEEGLATHSGSLAWRIPMVKGTCGLQSTGLQRVRHD